PDLWNWWDPARPGYNPANRDNVEWTSWSAQDAVREGWRNWGSAHVAGMPHPNIASPQVLEATRAALRELAPLIRDWHASLPAARKHLLVGVKVGWEVSIGVNYFYPAADRGAVCPPPVNQEHLCTFQSGRQVGYAAVATAGIRRSGTLTSADLDQVVRTYVTELTRVVYESGIPRRKIFTHVGPAHVGDETWGQDRSPPLPPLVRNGTEPALSPYAHAGWSFYTGDVGAAGVKDLGVSLDSLASTGWGLVEWGGPETKTADRVAQHLDGYLAHQNNKLVAAHFDLWHPAQDFSWHATGLNRVLSTGVTCWMHPPVGWAWSRGPGSMQLGWSTPGRAERVYLNVTTDPRPSVQGGFQTVNVFNGGVSGSSGRTLDGLPSGTYYWKLFADGCGRRVISDLHTFVVP
ncbi:MAG TPA: hypothetical protein VE153_12660, partial [Myxococcus sp.]|nr:hypothetical protein [Myxococcus sp.]